MTNYQTKNIMKRTLAGVMAIMCVAGYIPATIGGAGVFNGSAIVASADDTEAAAYSVTEITSEMFPDTSDETLVTESDLEEDPQGTYIVVSDEYVTYTKVAANAPTCTEDGNIEYYTYDLGNFYTDDEGTELTDLNEDGTVDINDTVIPATGHSYGKPKWDVNADFTKAKAIFTCTEGDDVVSLDAKITVETTEPTYTSAGKTVYTASVTFNGKGYSYQRKVDIAKLGLTHFEAVEPTCTEPGNIEYWYDADADKYFSDASGENEITEADIVDEATGHTYGAPSFILTPLTAGEQYKVAIVTKIDGQWFNDFSNAIVGTPKAPEVHVYPEITSIDYNEQYHQFRLNWSAVPNAQNYGVAVYLAGKWKIMTQTIPADTTSYTSPKLKAGQTYKMLVAAKVNGQWDLTAMTSRAFTVTVK